jgi:hypothetical protein
MPPLIPIEDLQGVKHSYTPNYYYNYPFKMSIDGEFLHKNCICVAVTRYKNIHTGSELIGYKIDFLEQVSRQTYKDKLDFNGFECQGLALIESTEEDSIDIIKDLKANINFYVEKALDLL